MSLIKRFAVPERSLANIPPVHGFDNLTRLSIRLANVPGVTHVTSPSAYDYYMDCETKEIVRMFTVERRADQPWETVEPRVLLAVMDFYAACAVNG